VLASPVVGDGGSSAISGNSFGGGKTPWIVAGVVAALFLVWLILKD
jgi:hypothetical protein